MFLPVFGEIGEVWTEFEECPDRSYKNEGFPVGGIIGNGADGLHRFEWVPAFLKFQTIPLDHLAGEQIVDVEREWHG